MLPVLHELYVTIIFCKNCNTDSYYKNKC
jgi:hypothetical protein